MVLSPACTCSSLVWNVSSSVPLTAFPACVAMVLGPPCRERCQPPVFDPRDLLGRDVVVTSVVERVPDRGAQKSDKGRGRKPQNVPDQGDPEHGAKPRQDDACAGFLRHVDGFVALQGMIIAPPFHVP